jgi:hypothetical protein
LIIDLFFILIFDAELSYTSVVTMKCDVYSFGVVALEIVMGMYTSEIQYLASREQHRELVMEDMLDKRQSSPTIVEEKEIALLVEVAFACLQTSPQFRPEMEDVYQKLALHKPPSSFASPSHAPRPEEIIEVLGHLCCVKQFIVLILLIQSDKISTTM